MSYQLSKWEVDTIRDNLDINETGRIMSYSGRAMYGDECLGIVTDNVARMSMLLASALAVIGGRAYDLITELTDTEIRTDSMARDIVVYFPNITFPDDFVDEDDE